MHENNSFAGVRLNANNVRYNEPMREHTSFKLGGPADIFIEPDNAFELAGTLEELAGKGIPHYIIGNGTNLLVSDKGIRGAVVKIGDKFGSVEVEGESITAESGVLLSALAKVAAKNGLAGFEFASGIPGALGGALAMNAGAYGGEMKDVVEWVEVLNEDLQRERLSKEKMNFGYRKSAIEERKLIALRCCIRLRKGDPGEINRLMAELTEKRTTKQPLSLPSAGSTFKRPEGYFAGKLIEDAGLRGFSIGGAQVSTLHCGFVVNKGNAVSKDVYDLIRHVQAAVYEKFNVRLEPEVKLLGEFQ